MVREEALSSPPRNRVKLLCSYGGKILPNPSNGHLKYVGGETRVVVVPRTITFSELMKKMTTLFDADVVLKYQLMPDDLDALVSVTCDEDASHMLEEYDQYEAKSSGNGRNPRLRAFLFPSTLIILENHVPTGNTGEPQPLEQRYIDAINGIVRKNSSNSCPNFSISSTSSSPRYMAPDAYNSDTINHDTGAMCNRTQDFPRVQSSPSLFNLTHNHSHNHNYNHQLHNQSRLGRLAPPPLTMVRSDGERLQMGQLQRMYYFPVEVQRGGNGGWTGCSHVDEYGYYRSGGFGEGEYSHRSPR
ncbi:octicosapeptide/Phox/Bem1p family protein [Tasmannia lanceolata]|uniref:octicosapeptide/Phox/Bem1p family protein n=1 Tax=Tasmannia lanceolata TaxID=3420 RepID=UPI004062EEEB